MSIFYPNLFFCSISYVKGTQNKAADGLSRAYDDGLVKYDDLITARHPALNKLSNGLSHSYT